LASAALDIEKLKNTKKWSSIAMEDLMAVIKKGVSQQKVYNVPKSTLHDHALLKLRYYDNTLRVVTCYTYYS